MRKKISKTFSIIMILLVLCSIFPMISYAGAPTSSSSTNVIDMVKELEDLTIKDSDTGPYIEQYKTHINELQEAAWNTTYTRAQSFLIGLSGVLALVFLQFLISNALKLGTLAGKPQERSRVMQAILWNSIGLAGFAISGIIMALAFKLFQ